MALEMRNSVSRAISSRYLGTRPAAAVSNGVPTAYPAANTPTSFPTAPRDASSPAAMSGRIATTTYSQEPRAKLSPMRASTAGGSFFVCFIGIPPFCVRTQKIANSRGTVVPLAASIQIVSAFKIGLAE